MSILFEPFSIKSMEIKNRFVRSATYDGCAAVNGYVSDAQIKLYSSLADGGVGLIISGIAFVHPSGEVSPLQNSIAGDEYIPGLQELTKQVHNRGAKIAVQLFHGGREAAHVQVKNLIPLAPSVIEDDPYHTRNHREITDSEILAIISAFGDGARRAKEAGFDAVQIHAAHAYLFSQFLSPFTNRREDRWGGNLQNRLRFHSEVYDAIRKQVGEDYPVLIKLGIADGFQAGLQAEDGIEAAKFLAKQGFDCLEISQGLRGKHYEETEFKTNINSQNAEAYYHAWSREIKAQVDVPIMTVGGLRTLSLMEEIVQNNEADFVSLCRPLICEPGIINTWKRDPDKKANCISCNKCVAAIFKGQSVTCMLTYEKNIK